MPNATAEPTINQSKIDQYKQEGYMILERVIPNQALAMLREECAYFIGHTDGVLEAEGKERNGPNFKGKRYFVPGQYRRSHRLWRFIYGEIMAEVAKATVGENACLFYEQWVVKGPEQGMKFAWHQDSAYVRDADPATTVDPYVTCWLALDDVTEENGTAYLLPHSRAKTREGVVEHTPDETGDLVGYHGDDPGDPVIVPAGSIAAFSSHVFHRSGSNTTPDLRRVYLLQYSVNPILKTSGEPWAFAVPFLKNGEIVYDREADVGGV